MLNKALQQQVRKRWKGWIFLALKKSYFLNFCSFKILINKFLHRSSKLKTYFLTKSLLNESNGAKLHYSNQAYCGQFSKMFSSWEGSLRCKHSYFFIIKWERVKSWKLSKNWSVSTHVRSRCTVQLQKVYTAVIYIFASDEKKNICWHCQTTCCVYSWRTAKICKVTKNFCNALNALVYFFLITFFFFSLSGLTSTSQWKTSKSQTTRGNGRLILKHVFCS